MSFWDDYFHICALQAAFIAFSENRLMDSEYVREMAYGFYMEGKCARK